MKRFAVALVVATLTAAIVGGPAGASGEAITYRGFPCIVYDGDGGFVVTTNSVETVYASGKVVLHCEASGVANSTGGIVKFNYANTGELCSFFSGGTTTVWHDRIGAGGVSQLTCTTWRNESLINVAALSAAGVG